jgi:lysophospholipase L1-like esterase
MDAATLVMARLNADKRFSTIGPRFGFLGDSLTAGAVDNSTRTRGWAWPIGLGMLSGGSIRPVIVDGFPGQRSDQILPFVTDILAAGVNTCVVAFGTNDILQSVAVTVPQANIKTAVRQLKAAGIQPVMATVPPNSTSAWHAPIATLNAWIKRYAAANRIPVIDFHTVLVDPSSGAYAAAYANDGTHPNAAGYLAMAQAAWTTLQPLVLANSPLLSVKNTDPISKLNTNACFLTDAGADGKPDSWTRFGGGTGFTDSIVTGDTAITGNWWQLVCSSSSADQVLEFNCTTGIVPGNTILVTGRAAVTSYSSGNGLSVKVTFTGGSQNAYPLYQLKALASGVFYQELTIPTGTTAILFDVIVGAGTVTTKLAQPTILDLTALGLVNL